MSSKVDLGTDHREKVYSGYELQDLLNVDEFHLTTCLSFWLQGNFLTTNIQGFQKNWIWMKKGFR
ncbi:hypothetical protein RJ641_034710 [Dillenia turbinata]|uniref:Uncharacterized protein n=1 Tax=Dillenia turbinata TaxID=194707 RepID=A0AAN8VHY0_9MAGN